MAEIIRKWFDSPFRQQENGKIVFYPWGFPGEGFLVNNQQKQKITFFYVFYFLCFFCWFLGAVSLEELGIITRSLGMYSFILFIMATPLSYLLAVYIIKTGKELFVLPRDERPINKGAFLWAVPAIIHIEAFLLFTDKLPFYMLALLGLSLIFTIYLFVKIPLTRGHFFTSQEENSGKNYS